MMSGDIKKILIECLQKFVKDFQDRRAKVTEADVKQYMSIRKIEAMPKAFLEAKAKAQAEAQAQVQAKAAEEEQKKTTEQKKEEVAEAVQKE